jgi:hypothetical protein
LSSADPPCPPHPFGDKWKLLYTGEYAKQNDYAGGDARIDAYYLRLGVGGQLGDFALRVDRELLSSNDGLYAFQTPLGTNHLFQGWADQFLTTPRQGIRDTFLSASAKIKKRNCSPSTTTLNPISGASTSVMSSTSASRIR